jgi:hypothetical protein
MIFLIRRIFVDYVGLVLAIILAAFAIDSLVLTNSGRGKEPMGVFTKFRPTSEVDP